MKTKKLICGVVAVATAVTLLAGCGGGKKTSSQQGEKLTVWMPLVSNASMVVSNFGETELAKKVMEETGVDVEFVHPPQGQEKEKFSIVVASANLPDIIEYNWLAYPGGPAKAIKEGVIIDLAKHADKAPNMFGYLNENPEIKKLATTDAGEVFSFPFVRGDESLCFSSGIIVRGDWLEELGLAMPETIDEWESVLTAFKEKKGSATPYDNKKNDFYTDKEQGSMPYGGIVFAICKMFEQSIDYDIKEGFTKSIVDSKERTKEYRKDSAMGIHHGM